jgi:hypothetical protein
MGKTKKISSVIELSKYKVNSTVYMVDLLSNIFKQLLPSDTAWMTKCHPKIFFEEGVYKYNTLSKHVLPRLPGPRFSILSALLSSSFSISSFVITAIQRCPNTGEFYYFDSIDEWHPESIIFPTANRAKQEKRRILNLMTDWVMTNDHL